MKQKVINEVMQGMLGCLNNVQLERLQEVLEHALFHKQVSETEEEANAVLTNEQLLDNFLAAKRIEGCSENVLCSVTAARKDGKRKWQSLNALNVAMRT
jgi:hypothetical protein